MLLDLFFEILKWKRKKNSSRQDIGFEILMVRFVPVLIDPTKKVESPIASWLYDFKRKNLFLLLH